MRLKLKDEPGPLGREFTLRDGYHITILRGIPSIELPEELAQAALEDYGEYLEAAVGTVPQEE